MWHINTPGRIAVVGAFLIVLIGSGGFYYYEKIYLPAQTKTSLTMYVQKMQGSETSFYTGDYAGSISTLQGLLSSAPNKTEKGRLQLLIASSLVARNQNDDLAQGVSLLKQITNDFTIAPWVRALAYNSIAGIVITKDSSFYTLYFTDAPLNGYLPSSGSDISKIMTAYFKILQLSDNTFPNSFAEYSIAGNYYAPLTVNPQIAKVDLNSTAKLMQQYVAEGDALNDQTLYSPTNVIFMQIYRALALSRSGSILNTPSLADREKAFQLPLQTIDTYQKNGQTFTSDIGSAAVLKAHFWYANFLLNSFGDKRNTDIQNLLQPFADANPLNYQLGMLAALNNTPDTIYVKIQALKLAQISPDLKKFLISTGVPIK